MPPKKGKRKKNKISSVGQQNREIERNHDLPKSHLASSCCNVTAQPNGAVSTSSLAGPQACLSFDVISTTQPNSQGAKNVILLDQSLIRQTRHKRCKKDGREPRQVNLMTSTKGADDTTLLNIIESVDHDRAVELLKGNHSVSQDGLDKALLSACQHGHKYMAQRLVGFGANVNCRDAHGNTPLLISAENGFIDIVHTLIMRKADINACNCNGNTALISSIRSSGSAEMVKVLLAQDGIDIKNQNQAGSTALMKAMEVKDIDTVKMLMDRNAKGRDDRFSNLSQLNEINESDICVPGSIFQLLRRCSETGILPLSECIKTRDIESLNILLDCWYVSTDETKTNATEAFKKMFDEQEMGGVKTFTDTDIAIINKLLECGAHLDIFYYGSTPLSVAVDAGNYGLVELLCKHLDRQQEQLCEGGLEPLKSAAKIGRCDLIELLLKYGAYISPDEMYDSPLDSALRHGHLDCAQLLIRHGADIFIELALDSAVDCQMPVYMNFLVENYKQDVKSYVGEKNSFINSLLTSAVTGGNLVILSHILDAGADVNSENSYGETPIVESKNGEVALLLVKRGAAVNIVNDRGNTPLLNVLMNRHKPGSSPVEVVQVLLENGALVNSKSEDGRTPLMVTAFKRKNLAMLKVLLDHGANVSDKDQDGWTALMHAVYDGCTQNVSLLLKFMKGNKDLINLQNLKGFTALMGAAQYGSLNMVKELIDHGADVNIKDVDGNDALLHAITISSRPDTEIVTTLIRAGSDVNWQNNDGLSPLMMAAVSSKKQVISVLLDSEADVNAVSNIDNTKTALSILSNNLHFENDTLSCIEELLDRGASSSYTNPRCIHEMIIRNKIQVIPKLIRCGLGPADVKPHIPLEKSSNSAIKTVSPLCVSLLTGNVALARYFEKNLFLTLTDVSALTCNKKVQNILGNKNFQECLNFLDEMASQPWSLVKLALVSVSSAVGILPGRENRVKVLPLPEAVKDKLLFKSEDTQINILEKQNAGSFSMDLGDGMFLSEMSPTDHEYDEDESVYNQPNSEYDYYDSDEDFL